MSQAQSLPQSARNRTSVSRDSIHLKMQCWAKPVASRAPLGGGAAGVDTVKYPFALGCHRPFRGGECNCSGEGVGELPNGSWFCVGRAQGNPLAANVLSQGDSVCK
ncbi:UNVERIFIED_CONTAM: hypothetical protein K2H54_044155 [Gekko kuhli]